MLSLPRPTDRLHGRLSVVGPPDTFASLGSRADLQKSLHSPNSFAALLSPPGFRRPPFAARVPPPPFASTSQRSRLLAAVPPRHTRRCIAGACANACAIRNLARWVMPMMHLVRVSVALEQQQHVAALKQQQQLVAPDKQKLQHPVSVPSLAPVCTRLLPMHAVLMRHVLLILHVQQHLLLAAPQEQLAPPLAPFCTSCLATTRMRTPTGQTSCHSGRVDRDLLSLLRH
jgi:hypothetical protein